MDHSADIAIVGAGIAGLAHAYMALQKGYKVVLFEREQFAVGASVRNFGLLWPIGQEESNLDRALRSRQHWSVLSKEANFWLNENGSLHLAYHDDEMQVLEEFISLSKNTAFKVKMLMPDEIARRSEVVNVKNLKGGMISETEATIYSREAIRRIPLFLQEKFGLILRLGQVVKEVNVPTIETSREKWKVEKVIICSGADFETLYPEIFDQHKLTKCKLQMMRGHSPSPVSMGPSLCAGLTLLHYKAFNKCESLVKVQQRYDETMSFNKKFGIHVLLAQNPYGEFIIGDSHEYGGTIEPFDREDINQSILDYLHTFANLPGLNIVERWNGVYPKLPSGSNLVVSPEKNVTIVNGLGGAGMTLSFGLAEEVIDNL